MQLYGGAGARDAEGSIGQPRRAETDGRHVAGANRQDGAGNGIVAARFETPGNSYSENMLNLTLASGYVKKLLDNAKVARFLNAHDSEYVFGVRRDRCRRETM